MTLRRLVVLTLVAAFTLLIALITASMFPHPSLEADAAKNALRTAPDTPSPIARQPATSVADETEDSAVDKPAPVKRSIAEIERAAAVLEQAPQHPADVLDDSVVELYGVDLSDVFPPGTTIDVDTDSWTDVDEVTALVATTITRPGHQPERYSAVLGKSNGEWLLLGTLPLEETDSTMRGQQ